MPVSLEADDRRFGVIHVMTGIDAAEQSFRCNVHERARAQRDSVVPGQRSRLRELRAVRYRADV